MLDSIETYWTLYRSGPSTLTQPELTESSAGLLVALLATHPAETASPSGEVVHSSWLIAVTRHLCYPAAGLLHNFVLFSPRQKSSQRFIFRELQVELSALFRIYFKRFSCAIVIFYRLMVLDFEKGQNIMSQASI